MGRPEMLTDDQKSLITRLKDEHPGFKAKDVIKEVKAYLIAEAKKELPTRDIKEIEKLVEDERLSKSAIIKFLTDYNNTLPAFIDTHFWNTSVLNSEPISPDALPWLIGVQVHLKSYCSKPLTIREAKWFNRLSGFRYTFPVSLESLGISDRTKDAFLSLVIATWAQIYAYREKIDTIARIKEPDYSELDRYIATGDFESMHKYEWDFDFKEIPKFVDKPDVTVDDLIRFDEKRLFPGVLAQLKYLEVPYLRHSLGEPDMSREAKGLYHQTLTTIRQDVSYDKRLFELTYPQKIKLLCHLRQWYKENPNEDNAQENLNSLIEAHFEYVEKDGEAK